MSMNKLIIERTKEDNTETIGEKSRVEDDNGANLFSFISLERPWKNNEHKISRIVPGRYFYKKILATNHIPYEHLLLDNVTGRDGICVHRLNLFSESLGCIGVGSELKDINNDGEDDILHSKDTLTKILSLLPEQGIIDIIDNF